MQRLPVLSGKDIIRILSKAGFLVALKKAVVVPNHKEIDKGTLLEIIRQSGLTREKFVKLIDE